MEPYKNSSGTSGVSAYEIGIDYIEVAFNGTPKIYTYSYDGKAGKAHVDNMKQCAISGSGLNTYINKYTKKLYD